MKEDILENFSKHCKKCDGLCCKKAEFTVFNSELEKLPVTEEKLIFRKKFKENIERISMGKKCPFLKIEKGCTLAISKRPLDCLSYPIYPILKYNGKKETSIVGMMVHRSCPFAKEISLDKKLVALMFEFWKKELLKITKADIRNWFGKKENYWLDKNIIKIKL